MKSVNFNYIGRLDHLRFLAALLVMLYHFRGVNISFDNFDGNIFTKFIKIWLIQGYTGVSLFLVLSAFLFTLICNAGLKRIDYGRYLYNRVLRIFPLLIIVIFIVITLDRANSTPLDILRVFTLQLNTGNSMTGWGHEIFPVGPIWTIAVEFQFYLIFPILILFLRKFGIRQLIIMILFILVIRTIVVSLNSYEVFYNLYHSILGRIDQFMIGIILGALYIKGYLNRLGNIFSVILMFFSILYLTWLLYMNQSIQSKYYSSVMFFTLEAMCWSGFIIGYLSFNFSNNKIFDLTGKTLSFLGGLSFSIYLLHLPIGMIITSLFELPEPNGIAQSILFSIIRLPFIIGVSILSFYAIEKPFMSLRVKYLK